MPAPDTRPNPAAKEEIDLLDILVSLWVGKFWILGAIIPTLVLGAFFVFRVEPLYRAQGLLQLEVKASSLALPEGMQELLGAGGGLSQSPGEAETVILKSRMVIGEAVRALDLQISAAPRPLPVFGLLPARLRLPDPGLKLLAPYQWGNESIAVAELEVKPDWLGEEMVLTITGPETYVLRLPDGSEIEGKTRARLSSAENGVAIVVDRLEGPAGREFTVIRSNLATAVRKLQRKLTVNEAPRGSSILEVTYTDPSPRKAEQILDAIAQAYLSQNIARSSAEAQKSLKFIDEQLPVAEQSVTEAQNALNAYRQQQQSVDVDYETRVLLERATEIEVQLSGLAIEEETFIARYTISHPAYQALLQNRATLERQLDKLRESTSDLPEIQKQIFNLTRNLEVAQQVYLQLLNRQQELRVVQASTVGSVRVIDTAFSDNGPVSPRTYRTLTIFLVAGLGLGACIVLLRRAMRGGILGAQQIEASGLPVFATINFAPDVINPRDGKAALPIHAVVRSDDLVTEALRSLRTALHFGMLDSTSKSILLTSAAPGVGKTFLSVNLAVVAAQAGRKVCLIDADLRRGYVRRYFNKQKNTPGLTEYLAGDKSLEEVLLQTSIDGLSVITSGRFPPNPSELLMRAEFETLLGELDQIYDLVIVDCPPALAVTDPVIIGRYVGARIVVARHVKTRMAELEAVRTLFETSGRKLTGAILNGYKASEAGRIGGESYSYNYRYDYSSQRNGGA